MKNNTALALKKTTESQLADQLREWMDAIFSGNKAAENELCSHLYQRFDRYFLSKGFAASAIEDATQEALLSLLDALRKGNIDDSNAIEGYFFTSVKYQLWHSCKKAKRYIPMEDNVIQLHTHPQANCADQVETMKELEHVVRSMNRLRVARDKEILVRAFFQEEAIDTICEEYDFHRDHYYRVLHRARNRLQKLI